MDPWTTILAEWLVPWWKPMLPLLTAAFGVVAFRALIKFDLNAWLESRQHAKELRAYRKQVARCDHYWMLYKYGRFSQCTLCLAYTSTANVMTAQELGMQPRIAGCDYDYELRPGPNTVIVGGTFRDPGRR